MCINLFKQLLPKHNYLLSPVKGIGRNFNASSSQLHPGNTLPREGEESGIYKITL